MDHSAAAARLVHAACPRTAWLLAVTLAAIGALWWHGPIPQWDSFHAFADTGAWGPVPNAANVLSNLPFLLVGIVALLRLRRVPARGPAHPAWTAFAAAIACTAAGSALYHWAPANGPLVFDRLPIAWACASLLCALLAERVAPRWGSAPVVAAALLAATAAVGAWWLTGDLRPYVAVQFLPMLLVPAAAALRLPPTAPGALAGRDWFVALGLYGLAKLLEGGDVAVHATLGAIGGHPLKHLVAAAAAAWLLRAALLRA